MKKHVMEKGEYGYLSYKKKMFFLKVLGCLAIGISIFLTGLLIKKTHKNVMTVMAMLMVLPGAKELVGWIIIHPLKPVSRENYEKMKSKAPKDAHFYTGLVMTSPDKVMYLDYLVEVKGSIVGLLGKKGQDAAYIKDYLEKGVRGWGYHYSVKIYDDEEKFEKVLKTLAHSNEVREEEQKSVLDYLLSLIVA